MARMYENKHKPTYIRGYYAQEMDEYLDYLDITIDIYKSSQRVDAKIIADLKAENARLRDALK